VLSAAVKYQDFHDVAIKLHAFHWWCPQTCDRRLCKHHLCVLCFAFAPIRRDFFLTNNTNTPPNDIFILLS